jgi:hypothetical protein
MSESWIRTYTGLKFDPFHPDPEAICIEDIAHALALQNRFSGHTYVPYSVAQHSVSVSLLVPRDLSVQGLLHDASEAYLVDIPSPIKHQPALRLYRELESAVMSAIGQRFKLDSSPHVPWWNDPVIKTADAIMGATEARDLMKGWEEFPSRSAWMEAGGPTIAKVKPLHWHLAEGAFLGRWEKLGRRIND